MPKLKKVLYKIKLEVNNTSYKASGQTLLEALSNLSLNWTQVKTKGILIVDFGSKHIERLYYLRPLRKLINSKIRKLGQIKQLEALMK